MTYVSLRLVKLKPIFRFCPLDIIKDVHIEKHAAAFMTWQITKLKNTLKMHARGLIRIKITYSGCISRRFLVKDEMSYSRHLTPTLKTFLNLVLTALIIVKSS